MLVSLLTGGEDRTYVYGLLSGLISKAVTVDLIGGERIKNTEIIQKEIIGNKYINYYDIYEDEYKDSYINASVIEKFFRILKCYVELIIYAFKSNSKLFHIQWLNKFVYFDRIFLTLYYKVLGKKIVYTVHNINIRNRDGNDSLINRCSLKFMYKIVDHLIVHNQKMKEQLIHDFNIEEEKISVISIGINNAYPNTNLTRMEARKVFNLDINEKTLLFFGNISPYKGLKYLIIALDILKKKFDNFSTNLKLIIAGEVKKESNSYWKTVQDIINEKKLIDNLIIKAGLIPDDEIEYLFKSADVLLLPYEYIFQSGVLFLSYNYGLPVIASNVGSLREDIIEGETGFICNQKDPDDLAEKIYIYFQSDLFKNLEENRKIIIKYANEKYSWNKIGKKTNDVYKRLLKTAI